ncbi:hypothetical protein ACFXAZ_34670 [Streptomyces sp. NPDC059477]|uniref:hypothetical protein n=1 Tax=Streptomyces sp. NPDC059477 TaxID=3346847 RepID=UPI003675011D
MSSTSPPSASPSSTPHAILTGALARARCGPAMSAAGGDGTRRPHRGSCPHSPPCPHSPHCPHVLDPVEGGPGDRKGRISALATHRTHRTPSPHRTPSSNRLAGPRADRRIPGDRTADRRGRTEALTRATR